MGSGKTDSERGAPIAMVPPKVKGHHGDSRSAGRQGEIHGHGMLQKGGFAPSFGVAPPAACRGPVRTHSHSYVHSTHTQTYTQSAMCMCTRFPRNAVCVCTHSCVRALVYSHRCGYAYTRVHSHTTPTYTHLTHVRSCSHTHALSLSLSTLLTSLVPKPPVSSVSIIIKWPERR